MANENYEGFDLTIYNLFTLLREMYYTRGETETNFLSKSGGTLGGSLTIQGNLTVQGNSYKIDTENLVVKDYTITLAKDNDSALLSMVGMVVPKYDGTNYGFFGWDADGYAYVGDLADYDGSSAITLAENTSLQKIATIKDTATGTTSDDVMVYDQTNKVFKKAPSGRYVIEDNELVASNDNKALYNLGSFDTISGNTITRQTGYKILDGSENWTLAGATGYLFQSEDYKAPFDNQFVNNSFSVSDANTMWGNTTQGIAFDTNRINLRIDSITTVADLKAYLSSHNVYIQYKLATSYTESIIPNTPLLTLDQNGCNFLRNEWEKGLNLWDEQWENIVISTVGDISANANVICSKNFIRVNPNTTYTIGTGKTSQLRVAYYTSGKTFISTLTGNQSNDMSVTTPSNCYYIKFCTLPDISPYYGGTYLNDIMLVEGSHAYPYQEYNGAIVREKDIEPVLLWENPNPNDAFAGQTITTKTMSKKYIIVGAKYYKDNVWGTQFFKFAREDVNYYCQIGTFFRLITIVNNTSITITNNKDITSEQDANNNNLVITSISETNVL